MRNASLRFFAVEHLTGMIIGTALAHVGKSKIAKTADAAGVLLLAVIFSASRWWRFCCRSRGPEHPEDDRCFAD